MKVRVYTNEEISILRKNIFVRDVKYKREINYDPVFKLWCIMMRLDFPELSAREIFARGGFDINILHKKLPQRRIKDWLDNYRKFGIKYFLPETDSYSTIRKTKESLPITYDNMKMQLIDFVLKRLKEINYDNR